MALAYFLDHALAATPWFGPNGRRSADCAPAFAHEGSGLVMLAILLKNQMKMTEQNVRQVPGSMAFVPVAHMAMCSLQVLTFNRRLPVYSLTFLRAMLPADAAATAHDVQLPAKVLMTDAVLQAG